MSTTRCHTWTGTGFDPLNPRAQDVRLGDVAHHLSMIVRFGGAVPLPYTVAEHAMRVARLVEEVTGDPVYTLHALHHDSAEAYIGDVRRPLKEDTYLHHGITPLSFGSLEARVLVAIVAGLQIPVIKDPDDAELCRKAIKEADDAVLASEFRAFFPDSPEGAAIQERVMLRDYPIDRRKVLSHSEAREQFMAEHVRLAKLAQLMGSTTTVTLQAAP